MTCLTDPAQPAVTEAGPGAGFGITLAEIALYWDTHKLGRPVPAQPVINFRARSRQDVEAIARWLGVNAEQRHGTWFAQRRFGEGADSVIVEAHHTPDKDQAHRLRVTAKDAAGQRLLAGAA
jgi:hypothetical protein